MPSKKDYEELVIRVDERTKAIPKIEEHLVLINGSVAEVTRNASVNRTLIEATGLRAEQACDKADNNTKSITKLAKVVWIVVGILLVTSALLGSGLSLGMFE